MIHRRVYWVAIVVVGGGFRHESDESQSDDDGYQYHHDPRGLFDDEPFSDVVPAGLNLFQAVVVVVVVAS